MNDLLFTPTFFGFVPTKRRSLRNYLHIFTPEIVNYPLLGFDPVLWENLNRDDQRTALVATSIAAGAADYGILIKGYDYTIDGSGVLRFSNFVLG